MRRPSDFSLDDWLYPEDTPSNVPILKSVDAKLSKVAIRLFSYIVGYGQRNPDKSLASFVDLIHSEPRLVDEAFVQVIREQKHESPQFVLRMWELLLTLATVFFVSPTYQPFVRQTLATAALGQNKAVVDIAQLSYIRCCARCTSGATFRIGPPAFIEQIANHVRVCSFTFGASLRELMYRQRATHPSLRVPVFMKQLCGQLLGLGIGGAPETFQSPVSKARLDALALGIDLGQDMLRGASLAWAASLLRRWLGDLPVSIVTPDVYPRLQEGEHGWIRAVEGMSVVHRDALAYLIGFLKEVALGGSRTDATMGSLAFIIGSNCVRVQSSDMKEVKEGGELAKNLFKCLIANWDVTDVYPGKELQENG
jgi:hypothetical protein